MRAFLDTSVLVAVFQETLYTWNSRHWQQLGPAVSSRVRTP